MSGSEWDREQHRHQPFFCEENVWHLLDRHPGRPAFGIFIIGHRGPLWMTSQRAAPPGQVIGWDYHVVALVESDRRAWVLDLDSRLPFPVELSGYLQGSFPPTAPGEGRPRFRLVPAVDYRSKLRTDRRHMRAADGSWLHPPPPWPEISPGESNLARFLSPAALELGPWLSASELLSRWP